MRTPGRTGASASGDGDADGEQGIRTAAGSPAPPGRAAALDRPAALRAADVFTLAPSGLLELARDYVLLGRVRSPRFRGRVLAAEVEGGEGTYVARAELSLEDGDRVPRIAPSCTCPSQRPHCKHVLGLLLLWAKEPESFAPVGEWEAVLASLPAAAAAGALARAAMAETGAVEALRGAADAGRWDAQPPGRCLDAWPAFRAAAQRAGTWPDAALDLARRIAGPPGAPPVRDRVGLSVRQLAWWLTLAAGELPAPALLPWLQHLFALLEGGAAAGSLPGEVAVWLARLAAALPEERGAAARWIARFAAETPALRGVFEAELQRLLWERELAWRLAVGGDRVPEPAPLLRARAMREAFAAEAEP